MRALICHKSSPIVTRLKKELVTANKNMRFLETENYEEALELFMVYKPEIIILNLENQLGYKGNFLKKNKIFRHKYEGDQFIKSSIH